MVCGIDDDEESVGEKFAVFFIYDEYESSQICFIFPTEGEGAEAVKPCPFERMAKHFTKSTDLRNFEDNVDVLWFEIINFGQVNVHMCFARACARACRVRS
jgi:hypothetical protein